MHLAAAAREDEKAMACASGYYEYEMMTTGWCFVHVITRASCSNIDQAYAAGYVEGALSHREIWPHWLNTKSAFDYSAKMDKYLATNWGYLKRQFARSHDSAEKAAYWAQVELVYEQLRGIADGYNSACPQEHRLSEQAFMLMNSDGDISARAAKSMFGRKSLLRQAVDKETVSIDEEHDAAHSHAQGRCSGMVKVTAGNTELFTSQVAFTGLEEMLRMYKMYDFAFTMYNGSADSLPGKRMAFSSYPAHLFSGDDFYVISSGLQVQETTVYTYNFDLYKKYVTPTGTVLEWVRNLVANRLATSAPEWSKIFAWYNSGSYNNQWMITDYSLFTPGQPLKDNTAWVLEQFPGYIDAWDVTEELRQHGYWASYNIPASKKLFAVAGWPEQVAKLGPWLSYEGAPRAKLFKRDHVRVTDIDSFKTLMRYNDFKRDPLSRCPQCDPPYNAEFGIASRGDLNLANGSYPANMISHRDHSSIDTKVTSHALMMRMESIIVCGPTCDTQPVFKWSGSDFNILPHEGHPDSFNFPWYKVGWNSSFDDPWAKYVKNSTYCHSDE
eukprot:SM000261S09978  [mRNA]  locus=s261:135242:138770:- [translate_table: standard]